MTGAIEDGAGDFAESESLGRVANRRSTTTGCETVAGSAATGSAGSFHQEPRLLQGSYHPLKGLLAGAAQGVEMDAVGEQGQGPGGVFLHLPDKF